MLKINPERCDGKMHCLRVCPTQAIRVRTGKAVILEKRCVDCGRCLDVCPHDAIVPVMDVFANLEKHPFRVAVPSPALFGQFPREYSPEEISHALTRIGFHEAVGATQACEWVSWAVKEYLQDYHGPRPLISSFCPVVVRLIQVRYPSLIDQILQIKGPETVAVESWKQKRALTDPKQTNEISFIYLTPCSAMMSQFEQPLESEPKHIAGTVSIRDLYNPMLTFLNNQPDAYRWPTPTMGKGLRWARLGGSGINFSNELWITISGLTETITVLDDIESGKLSNTDYVEAWTCLGGCIGGPLTVENFYLAYHKTILAEQRKTHQSPLDVGQLRKLYRQGFFHQEKRPQPKTSPGMDSNLIEALTRRRIKEQTLTQLPMIDCGVCGAPDCATLAEDIARSNAQLSDCVFHGSQRLDYLKELFQINSRS